MINAFRSLLDALLPHLPTLQPLLGDAKSKKEKMDDRRPTFLRLLDQLLALDHRALLSGPSAGFLVDSFVGILETKCALCSSVGTSQLQEKEPNVVSLGRV